jgi:hypothetical protein
MMENIFIKGEEIKMGKTDCNRLQSTAVGRGRNNICRFDLSTTALPSPACPP